MGLVKADHGIIDAQSIGLDGVPTRRVRAGTLTTATVTVEQIPDLLVACVRHTGRHHEMAGVFADLFARLTTWAQPRDLVGPDTLVLSVHHDSPSITEDGRLRVHACITLPPGTETSGDVGQMSVPAGRFAVGHFELDERHYPEVLYTFAGVWLPDRGYEPDGRHPYERHPVDEAGACDRDPQ